MHRLLTRTTHMVLVSCAVGMLLLVACSKTPPASKRVSASAAPPVGLYGVWVSTQNHTSRQDTLFLLAHSVARGWSGKPGQPSMAVTRWQIKYLSKDPRDTRRDWNGGRYQDGGDLACTTAPDSTCVSAPVPCIGDAAPLDCMGSRFHGDSLALSNGANYRRAGADSDSASTRRTNSAIVRTHR
jgi:hypothetical protein